jgi:hypothetical protein
VRVYKVPIVLTEEPKIIGGKVSLRQAAHIGLGLFSGIAAVQALVPRVGEVAYPVGLICLATGCALGLVRLSKHDLDLDYYLLLWLRHKMSPKEYPYGC